MKRMNFTFFLLFALLSFVSSTMSAQTGSTSSSCIDEINISVGVNCGFEITDATLGATGVAMMADSISYGGTGSGTALAAVGGGFSGTGSLSSLFGSNRPGSVQYELYKGTQMVCWGTINFEIKNTPDAVEVDTAFMCGQLPQYLDFLDKNFSVADVLAANTGTCAIALSDAYENISTTQDKCNGNTWSRQIWASGSIDGSIRKILLRTDKVTEMPIDINDVLCPATDTTYKPAGVTAFGDPNNNQTAIYVPCDYPTDPAGIAKAFGPQFGYPHLNKGYSFTTTTKTVELIDIDTLFDQKVLVGDVWVLVDVINKTPRDSSYTVLDSTPIIVPVLKGTQCNLSTKCTDWFFAGCFGEESKTMRVWDIIDWCNGSQESHTQWIIKVESKEDVLRQDGDLGNIYAPIAPWTCVASATLPTLNVKGGCSDASETVYNASAGVIKNGVLTNIWLADCPIKVTATRGNECGGVVTDVFYVFASDETAPVAVAQDEINVSLTGDPTNAVSADGGVAKVYVSSIDAGSHDAGCGEVNTCVLLKEELENPILNPETGKPVYVDGNQIYAPSQCSIDGVWTVTVASGKGTTTLEFPYVICKDFVKFCCSDIGADNQVALVVTDNAGSCDPDFDGDANRAYSWTTVNVEDKSGAAWSCVDDAASCIYIDDFDPKKPSFGGVICNQFDVDEISREVDVTCGVGSVTVTWGAYDDAGELLSTTQCKYPVIPAAPFNPYEIKFPKHYDGTAYDGIRRECEVINDKGDELIVEYLEDAVKMGDTQACVAGADTGAPVWCNTSCGLIGSSYTVDTVSASDACYKLIKRWTIIDWCTWTPNANDAQDDANDTAYDQFQAVDDEWLTFENAYTDSRAVSTAFVGGRRVTDLECEGCEKPSGPAGDTYFRYTQVDVDGYYTFDQVIKIVDDVEPEIDAPAEYVVEITGGNDAKLPADYDASVFAGCVGSGAIEATASDMCGEIDLTAVGASWWVERTIYDADDKVVDFTTNAGSGETFTMGTGAGKPGFTGKIVWRVKDGCGNEGFAETDLTFVDTKNPTPVCIQDISTAGMNTDGSVAIWAADYNLGSFDNCSEVEVYFKDEDGNKVASLEFTCDNTGTNELAMYVSDASGNEDFCFVTLRIDDNTGACGPAGDEASILGEIATFTGDMVESATVSLSVGAQDVTDVEGQYAFSSDVNNTYRVKASKTDDYMNGVSTLDLVLIQKHVLGLQTLDSPFKVIAADINSDETVSAIDLVELRKLILGIYTELPNNDSWRFADATQSFDEPTNPFPFVEQLSVSLGETNITGQNFIATKVGDVSGNAIANSLIASKGRSAGSLSLQIADASVNAGELVEVAVSADAFNNISAYQFTMNVEGLEFVSVASGAVDMTAEGVAVLDANTITAAWFNTAAVSTSETLFTMTFKATANTRLSSAIALNSSVTAAEAYTASADQLDLGLTFDNNVASSFALFQNEPNPFGDVTRIGFEVPQAGVATLTVFDVTGKTVTSRSQDAAQGANFFELRKAELNASGVMYYQLESGEFTATKKMIVIE